VAPTDRIVGGHLGRSRRPDVLRGNNVDLFRRTGDFIDQILKGAKPADLPVEQPTKFELIINLATPKAMGLRVLESFLLRADEVIE
jgi:putative ABC transport system substrate-binding protein